MTLVGAALALLSLALLAPLWHSVGRGTQLLNLPAITGIMLAGVASGPQGLNLLSPAAVAALAPVVHACLSLIALAAGAELHLPELRRLRRQVACVTGGISVCCWVLVYLCMRLLAGSIPFMRELSPFETWAVCSLAATLSIARSPASAIAVLKELDGKGSYCSLVMAVVVVKDVLLFAAFAVNIEAARAVGKSGDNGAAIWLLMEPVAAIALSVGLGVAAGYALTKLLRMRPVDIISISSGQQPGGASALHPPGGADRAAASAALARALRHPLALRLRPALPLAVSASAFGLAEALGAEPLLTCVAAGLVASNWRHDQQQGRDAAELLSGDLARLAPPVNALFFGLVGASLKLSAVRDGLWVAALLFLVRLAGVWVGCWLGAGAGGTPPGTAKRLWMGMVTQAGIALGLCQSVASRFPSWGPDFAAMWTGVVLMNLLTGPPLFKAAVVGAGEARGAGGRADPAAARPGSSGELPVAAIPLIPIISA